MFHNTTRPSGLAHLLAIRAAIDAARNLEPMPDEAMNGLGLAVLEIDDAIVAYPCQDRTDIALKAGLLAELMRRPHESLFAEGALIVAIAADRERLAA